LLRLRRVLKERRLTQDRIHMLEKLKRLSITDGLTQLYNSRYFYNQLKIEIDRTTRYQRPLSLLLLDIDNFKDYNDNYGHLEGDKVLVRLGQVIKSCLRKMDSAYRYGARSSPSFCRKPKGRKPPLWPSASAPPFKWIGCCPRGRRNLSTSPSASG
jgi:PleD family two-component response regulator